MKILLLPIYAQVCLSLAELYKRVLSHHPLARAIGLTPLIAQWEATAAKGVWDPTLQASFTEKLYKRQLYYALFSADLKIPVWNGIDLKGVYEQTGGFSLNPEDVTPASGFVGFGISIPLLGQGLFLDYRRAAIQKAQVYARMAVEERRLALAELLLEIGRDYWDWFAAYYKVQVLSQQLQVAWARLNFLRVAFAKGEATRADTLEGWVEVQARQQALLGAQADLERKALAVQRHLWDTSNVGDNFSRRYRPDSTVPAIPHAIWQDLIANHPKLRLYALKKQERQIHRRWAMEQLRPQLQLEYLWLRDAFSWRNLSFQSVQSGYKFGLTFAMPLYLRRTRAELAMTQLQIQQILAEQEFEARSLYNKALGQIGLIDSLNRQIELQRSLVSGLWELVELELVRYQAGESDLFVVNRREREAFAAMSALYDLYARYGLEVVQLYALLAWVEG
ncbi:MAG: TolC family protein [Bacteroidia bacterium]|nr:TolC family protein [Bacteroidia bacterium]MDW8088819.1 TolC family protein [Bacteroidia bacterium]